MRGSIFNVLLAVFLLPATAHAYRVPEITHWQNYTLQLINESRAEFDLPPIGIDEDLNELAKLHAQDSVVQFDDSTAESRRATYLRHKSSNRAQLDDRANLLSITGWTRLGENVGFRLRRPFTDVQGTIKDTIDFMHEYMMAELPPDDGHRKTILGDYTHVGIWIELHREAGSETNTLFYITDFAKFSMFKPRIIPEVGPRPTEVPTTRPITTRKITTPTRRRAPRIRSVDIQGRRLTEPQRIQSRAVRIESAPEQTWLQRNQKRVQKRREDKVKRLLERVAQRRAKRLKQRSF